MFYDGKCHLCAFEIQYYHKRNTNNSLVFVDIMQPDFDPESFGLDPAKIHAEFHVEKDSTIYTGVDAFIKIWQVLPGFGWLAKIAQIKPINLLMRVGYVVFAKIRPLLPQRKESCKIS